MFHLFGLKATWKSTTINIWLLELLTAPNPTSAFNLHQIVFLFIHSNVIKIIITKKESISLWISRQKNIHFTIKRVFFSPSDPIEVTTTTFVVHQKEKKASKNKNEKKNSLKQMQQKLIKK